MACAEAQVPAVPPGPGHPARKGTMHSIAMTDGSSEIARGALAAGVNLYAGYPITPASRIYEAMIRAGVGVGCPDEITVAQTLIGASLAGRKVLTATSAPGFALMVESLGAALMMEVPLTVVLVQRMGPSTGSATASAQGDVLAPLALSGGYALPTLCPARVEDCARLTAEAVNLAETLRTPVLVLTEREMVSGKRTVALDEEAETLLELPAPVQRDRYTGPPEDFRPYGNLNADAVPPFLEAGNAETQNRYTVSTHGEAGTILKATAEAIRNSQRLQEKVDAHPERFPAPRLDLQAGARTLVLSYGSTDYAAREAVQRLRADGAKVSHATVLTLFPVQADALRPALEGIETVVVPEENPFGLYRRVLAGHSLLEGRRVAGVNRLGSLIGPDDILAEVTP